MLPASMRIPTIEPAQGRRIYTTTDMMLINHSQRSVRVRRLSGASTFKLRAATCAARSHYASVHYCRKRACYCTNTLIATLPPRSLHKLAMQLKVPPAAQPVAAHFCKQLLIYNLEHALDVACFVPVLWEHDMGFFKADKIIAWDCAANQLGCRLRVIRYWDVFERRMIPNVPIDCCANKGFKIAW